MDDRESSKPAGDAAGDAPEASHPVPRVGSLAAYEPVDHTADLAYLVRGRTFEELFTHAALGMFFFLTDPGRIVPRERRALRVTGRDREECLITFLQELLFWEETQEFLLARVEVSCAGPTEVIAEVWGERFDRARHEIQTDIKAATYHDLEFRRLADAEGDVLEVRIVLDI
ncbi:MAG: archease [Candidatus Eisenbacteria bacterium]|uniref:Archease n=1 Tax=Eiseniibacteriota bacterium TaxID=2212470 RepID=A0A956M170_UNCEI|nr:archease [Candidatus Eisenbacteria bacterium]